MPQFASELMGEQDNVSLASCCAGTLWHPTGNVWVATAAAATSLPSSPSQRLAQAHASSTFRCCHMGSAAVAALPSPPSAPSPPSVAPQHPTLTPFHPSSGRHERPRGRLSAPPPAHHHHRQRAEAAGLPHAAVCGHARGAGRRGQAHAGGRERERDGGGGGGGCVGGSGQSVTFLASIPDPSHLAARGYASCTPPPAGCAASNNATIHPLRRVC